MRLITTLTVVICLLCGFAAVAKYNYPYNPFTRTLDLVNIPDSTWGSITVTGDISVGGNSTVAGTTFSSHFKPNSAVSDTEFHYGPTVYESTTVKRYEDIIDSTMYVDKIRENPNVGDDTTHHMSKVAFDSLALFREKAKFEKFIEVTDSIISYRVKAELGHFDSLYSYKLDSLRFMQPAVFESILVAIDSVISGLFAAPVGFNSQFGRPGDNISGGDFYPAHDSLFSLGGWLNLWRDLFLSYHGVYLLNNNKSDSARIWLKEGGNRDTLMLGAGSTDSIVVKLGSSSIVVDVNGNVISSAVSYKSSTITTSADNVNVAGIGLLNVDTAGGNVTIGGFIGGVANQILHLYNSDVNNIIIEDDEGTGNQDIKTSTAADVTITAEGGATLIYDGTDSIWRVIGCRL